MFFTKINCEFFVFRFQLQYDGERVTLLILDTQIHDAGTYILSARNSAGVAFCSCDVAVKGRFPQVMSDSEKATEAPAPQNAVAEPIKPVVQSPLKDVTVDEGKTIQLDCVITGQPEPEVIWYHNGQPVKESADVQLLFQDDRCSLVLQETVADDVGDYKVVAINSAGEAISQCTLTIVAKQVKEEPKAAETEAEQTATVEEVKEESVIVSELKEEGAEEEQEYEEIEVEEEEEEIIEEQVPSQAAVVEEEPTQAVVIVNNEQPAEEQPKPEAKAEEQPATIEDVESTEEESEEEIEEVEEVEEESVLTSASVVPEFEKYLSDILTDENETVSFECVTKGQPAPAIKWFLNNNELSESDRISFVKNNDGVAKLVIKNVTANDKGVYTVKAINSCGEAKCFSHLIVKSINAPENLQIPDQQAHVEEKQISPTFKEKFFDVIANIDETVKFECIVFGKPTPKIKWLYNDKPIEGKNFLASTTSGDRQVLTIPEVTHDCVGKVSCIAENEAGRAVCIAYLTLIGDASAPSAQESQRYIEEQSADSTVTIKRHVVNTTHTTQSNSFQNQNGFAPQPEIGSGQGSEVDGVPRGIKKPSAPRFISSLISKIIGQGSPVILEADIDGSPVPEITVTKNGDTLVENENLKITRSLNKVVIEIQQATAADAGRYSCTATNAHGSATSTADVVVKSMCLYSHLRVRIVCACVCMRAHYVCVMWI